MDPTGFPGIVTRFHLQLRPAPKIFRCSGYIFPKKLYRQAFDWILNIAPTFDHDTEIRAVAIYPDGQNEVCFMVYLVAMKNTAEEARNALLPAQRSRPDGAIEEWFSHEDSLEQEYAAQDNQFPGGRRWLVDNAFIKNDVDVPAVLEEAFMTLPSREFTAMYYPLSPHSRRPLPDMAFSLTSDHYFAVYAIYEDDKDDEKWVSWLQQTMKKVEPSSIGTFTGETDFQIRESKYWGKPQWERLGEIRKKWDPEGRICGYLDANESSCVKGLSNRIKRYWGVIMGVVIRISRLCRT
jgi:FAD/FMN-containing dehydrogenase